MPIKFITSLEYNFAQENYILQSSRHEKMGCRRFQRQETVDAAGKNFDLFKNIKIMRRHQ
jgi:hypothetical protein